MGRGATSKIWVDADASPRTIREVLLGLAARAGREVIFVSNQPLPLPPGSEGFATAVEVPRGPDVADVYIARRARSDDIVVTADIPLAEKLIARGVSVIDSRGRPFDPDDIGHLRALRDFLHDLREHGIRTGGPRPHGDEDVARFYRNFGEMLGLE